MSRRDSSKLEKLDLPYNASDRFNRGCAGVVIYFELQSDIMQKKMSLQYEVAFEMNVMGFAPLYLSYELTQPNRSVGWVKRSETHQGRSKEKGIGGPIHPFTLPGVRILCERYFPLCFERP